MNCIGATQGALLLTWINLNPSIDYIHYILLEEIAYPFPNFNGVTIEVWNG